jgi:hypothetical protein
MDFQCRVLYGPELRCSTSATRPQPDSAPPRGGWEEPIRGEVPMARKQKADKEAKVVGSFFGGGIGAAVGAAVGGPVGAAVGAGLVALVTHWAIGEASKQGL